MATTEELKHRSRALQDQAIQAALDSDWQRAIELNKTILDASPDDLEARMRFGRGLLELGRLDEAREAYEEVTKVEPNNLVANRSLARLKALNEVGKRPVQTRAKTAMRNFVEDMGKTGIVRIINTPAAPIIARYSPGSEAQLHVSGELVAVHGPDKELLGFLEPKVGRRLIQFLKAGNEYVAALVSTDPANPRIAIRETFQHPSMAGKVPFPGSHRPAETRAYIRGTFFRQGGGEEEDELAAEMEDESEGIKPEVSEEEEATGVIEDAALDTVGVEEEEDVSEDDSEEE